MSSRSVNGVPSQVYDIYRERSAADIAISNRLEREAKTVSKLLILTSARCMRLGLRWRDFLVTEPGEGYALAHRLINWLLPLGRVRKTSVNRNLGLYKFVLVALKGVSQKASGRGVRR